MDLKTIFNKTPKASRAPLPWVGGLSAQFKQILSYIDGKQNVEEILHKAGKLSINELHKILIKLEEDGYIKRVSSHQAEPDWLNDIGSFGINANNNYSIAVEEIDAAELDFDAADFSVNTATDTSETAEQQHKPEATVDADVERRAQEVKAIKAKRDAERKAQAEAAEVARIEAAEQAKRIAEAAAKARQEVERIEREKAEALAKAEAEAAARIQAELDVKAKAEAEEQARVAAELEAQEEAAEKARLEAERIAREEAEEQARMERERKAQEELATKAKQEAEEKARLEAERIEREQAEAIAREKAAEEARLQAEAERKAQAEAEEKARLEAERIAREKAEEEARLEAERIEREKAEELARIAAELKAQEEAAEKARLEAERIAREEAEEQARIERERKAQEELAEKAKQEAEEKARLEAERIEREKAEAIAREKAAEEARLQAEAERKAQAEVEEKARLEAERSAREAAEEEARLQIELARKAAAEAEEQARLEAERIEREKIEVIAQEKAQEEARLQAEAEQKAQAEADEKARIEAERMAQVAAAEQKLREAERVAREELKAQQEAEKKAQAEAEKAARAEAKLLAKEQKAAKAKLKAEEKARAKLLRGPVMTNVLASRLVKPLLISIPLVLILAVALMHVINLTMLIEPIEKLATSSVGEPVKVQQVHASLFPQPHLTLTDVTVGSNGDVKIGSVNMVSAVSMLFKEVKILDSIDISNVTLTPAEFGRQAQWVNNVAKSGKVKIEKMTLKQISLKVSDLEPEVFNGKVALSPSGELNNVEMVNAGGNLTLLLTPQNDSAALTLTASGWQPALFKRLAFDEVTATGVISQNQINFSQIEAKAFGGVIQAQGELNWAGGLRTSGNFELIKMTLPRVLAAYESDASITGTLNATGVFTSSANQASELEEAAQVDANFEVLTGKINGVALSHALVAGPASKPSPDADFTRFDTLTGNLQFNDGQYMYKQFALKTEQFRARGNFNIEPDKAVSGKVSAELTSATQRRQGNFTISGKVADVKFK